MRTAHRRCRTARHFQRGRRHLIHRGGNLLDLAALPRHGLITDRRYRLHLAGLTLDLDNGLAHPLDQVMNFHHGAIKHHAQLTQLVTAISLETGGHVTRRDFVHHGTQSFQRGPGRRIEAAVQVKNQEKDHGQRGHQQHHVRAVLHQSPLQFLIEKPKGGIIQLIGLRHEPGGVLIEFLPRHIQRVGRDHLFFEQLTALFECSQAGLGQRLKCLARGRTGVHGILQFQTVIGLKFFQILQQLIEAGTGR